MDIDHIVREYLLLNDPRMRQVTTKFAALLIAGGAVAAGMFVAVNTRDDGPDPFSGQLDAERAAAGFDAAGTAEECMPAEDVATWEAEHPDVVLVEKNLQPDGHVCLTFAP